MLPDSQTHLAPPPPASKTTSNLDGHAVQPQTKPIRRSRINQVDWLGAFLITVGLILLTFALGDGETAKPNEWKSPYIIVLLIVSVLMIAVFVWWEARLGGWKDAESEEELRAREERQRAENGGKEKENNEGPGGDKMEKLEPLLRLSIFRRANGKMSAMMCVAFFVWAGFSAWVFYAVVSFLQFFVSTKLSLPIWLFLHSSWNIVP